MSQWVDRWLTWRTTRGLSSMPHDKLVTLHAEAKGDSEVAPTERVLWMPSNEDRAALLRQRLEHAEVKGADRFADNDRQSTSPSTTSERPGSRGWRSAATTPCASSSVQDTEVTDEHKPSDAPFQKLSSCSARRRLCASSSRRGSTGRTLSTTGSPSTVERGPRYDIRTEKLAYPRTLGRAEGLVIRMSGAADENVRRPRQDAERGGGAGDRIVWAASIVNER